MTHPDDWKQILAGGQLVLGVLLFLMPWLVGFSAAPAPAWSAWVTGLLVALAGAGALAGYAGAGGWANLVLGAWAVIAPWVLGFAGQAAAMWSHVILGVLTVLAAVAVLWIEHGSSRQAHA
ncbi:SPW repeat protein [Caldovatus aquaticus]|uniref:SPW repeat protein n=1 Tax=Caldovatus aquaticus TaxID=2865671 RepID=A0ABS7F3K6_9PROT|nr:SPW repeat protein [Caldovatus aquaticus]MBW8270191.1 SPW repeat protein [Caldovatus aquaticus]